jgi:hypothetical protein
MALALGKFTFPPFPKIVLTDSILATLPKESPFAKLYVCAWGLQVVTSEEHQLVVSMLMDSSTPHYDKAGNTSQERLNWIVSELKIHNRHIDGIEGSWLAWADHIAQLKDDEKIRLAVRAPRPGHITGFVAAKAAASELLSFQALGASAGITAISQSKERLASLSAYLDELIKDQKTLQCVISQVLTSQEKLTANTQEIAAIIRTQIDGANSHLDMLRAVNSATSREALPKRMPDAKRLRRGCPNDSTPPQLEDQDENRQPAAIASDLDSVGGDSLPDGDHLP